MNAKEAAAATLQAMREKAAKDMAAATILIGNVERRISSQSGEDLANAEIETYCDSWGVANTVREVLASRGFVVTIPPGPRMETTPRIVIRISWKAQLASLLAEKKAKDEASI